MQNLCLAVGPGIREECVYMSRTCISVGDKREKIREL